MKRYFKEYEVVCPHVYERFGGDVWRFFDARIVEVIIWLRQELNRPITVNRYTKGLTQRGLRCNLCSLVRDRTDKGVCYMSPHVLGAALDFDVEGMTAGEVCDGLYVHALDLPHPIRLEKSVGWVHLDVASDGVELITYFDG